jgi:hypothetical protein
VSAPQPSVSGSAVSRRPSDPQLAQAAAHPSCVPRSRPLQYHRRHLLAGLAGSLPRDTCRQRLGRRPWPRATPSRTSHFEVSNAGVAPAGGQAPAPWHDRAQAPSPADKYDLNQAFCVVSPGRTYHACGDCLARAA